VDALDQMARYHTGVAKGGRGRSAPGGTFNYGGGTMGYAVGQGSGIFLAKEAMKPTYFSLYFRESLIIFFNT